MCSTSRTGSQPTPARFATSIRDTASNPCRIRWMRLISLRSVFHRPLPQVVGGNQMFTPTTDYNQQLFRYLQTWRELLEQWSTMTGGLPFPTAQSAMPTAPPGAFMPPMPPMSAMPPMSPIASMPPAPADYTQQLFGYLQAWRQYLEQMTGAWPGSPHTVAAQSTNASAHQAANVGSAPRSPHRPDVDIPPDNSGGTKSNFGSKSARESSVQQGTSPTWPPFVDVAPSTEGGTQVPPENRFSSANRVTRGPEDPERLI